MNHFFVVDAESMAIRSANTHLTLPPSTTFFRFITENHLRLKSGCVDPVPLGAVFDMNGVVLFDGRYTTVKAARLYDASGRPQILFHFTAV